MTASNTLYDPVRKKDVADTPEERVRQKLVQWLHQEIGISLSRMSVEFFLGEVDPTSSDRADLVIWPEKIQAGAGAKRQIWLLAECKRPEVKLGVDVEAQLNRYLQTFKPERILITNGEELLLYRLGENGYSPAQSFD